MLACSAPTNVYRLAVTSHLLLRLCVVGVGLLLCIPARAEQPQKKIVLLAGNPSHGYGSHEHLAGSRILAEAIESSTDNVVCEVYSGGWPQDDSVLEDADTIVMYCDGGGRHPALQHLPVLSKLMDRGVGFVCLHYGVEVPKDQGGPEFLKWLGGYFETDWSVNPHWTADYKSFPEHPVTRGVKPFAANDEWYFHMRFQPGMQGVTPILSAVPPAETMLRPDGPHSGNPAVREAVGKQIPQHMAWIYERPAVGQAPAGRSFGFTGGHYHWNWGREDILRLVCNAILWTAHGEIPRDGLSVIQPSVEKLEQGQDEKVPAKFDAQAIKEQFKLTAATTQAVDQPTVAKAMARVKGKGAAPKLLFASDKITTATAGHRVETQVDISAVQKLYLVCTDAGDGYSCDWADWANPTLIDEAGKEHDLTSLDWFVAESQWGRVHKGKNAGGQPLSINQVAVERGIGTHANSVIGFDLPKGFRRFKVTCGLDDGGRCDSGSLRMPSLTTPIHSTAAMQQRPRKAVTLPMPWLA